MSDATVQAVEDAIAAHFADTLDEDSTIARSGAVLINWVACYTVSNVVDVDGRTVVGYLNEYVAAPGDPNAAIGLTAWVSAEIATVLDND